MAKMSDIDRLMKSLYDIRDSNLKKINQSSGIDPSGIDPSGMPTSMRLELLEKAVSDIKELLKFGSVEELLNICEEEDE